MKKGDVVTLNMQQKLRIGEIPEERIYTGSVLCYSEKQECIYIQVLSECLTEFSLDAIYRCQVQTEGETLECTGRILERYHGEAGKIMKFQIKTGFYKINLKYVDKQMA